METHPIPSSPYIRDLLQHARAAARPLARSTHEVRNASLLATAENIVARTDEIVAANRLDVAAAREAGTASALLDRLMLDENRVRAITSALREVVALPDPLGARRDMGTRPNGLRIERRRVPLGVLAVVYEARPNVTIEAASLAIKSGNVIVLRGGREALRTNTVLASCMVDGLEAAGLPREAAAFVAETSREHVIALLQATGWVDLVIPRGGATLMQLVDEHARVPVIRHGQGITHLFIDASAAPAMCVDVVFNAKVQRPGVCNALETLIVHREAVENGIFADVARRLASDGRVELRADPRAAGAIRAHGIACVDAAPADWDTEFLALTLAVRVVDSLDEALDHIAEHGSHHTASILTEDAAHAERFLREVDASCVLWNASTRFNDGGELGLGAEMGISTSKMHAYGPMGLTELTTEKFVVYGTGQSRR